LRNCKVNARNNISNKFIIIQSHLKNLASDNAHLIQFTQSNYKLVKTDLTELIR